jgi:hypothetical protein
MRYRCSRCQLLKQITSLRAAHRTPARPPPSGPPTDRPARTGVNSPGKSGQPARAPTAPHVAGLRPKRVSDATAEAPAGGDPEWGQVTPPAVLGNGRTWDGCWAAALLRRRHARRVGLGREPLCQQRAGSRVCAPRGGGRGAGVPGSGPAAPLVSSRTARTTLTVRCKGTSIVCGYGAARRCGAATGRDPGFFTVAPPSAGRTAPAGLPRCSAGGSFSIDPSVCNQASRAAPWGPTRRRRGSPA